MSAVELSDLEAMVQKGQELKTLLKETPEILSFMKCLHKTGEKQIILPVNLDVLVMANQAAKVLGTDKSNIYRYVREGLLQPFYTPHSQYMKFWLSDVKALARKERITDEAIS